MPEPVTTSTSIFTVVFGSMPEVAEKISIIFAAVIGGVSALLFKVKSMNLRQMVFSVLAGAGMANYVAPILAKLFDMFDYVQTIGYLIGLFGIAICAALFDAIRKSDIWGLVKSRFYRATGGADDAPGDKTEN